jgi:hypothetical protein
MRWDASLCGMTGWRLRNWYLNTETVIGASKKVGLEVNSERTKYLLMSHEQNAGRNHNKNTANRSFENVAQFKYQIKSKFDLAEIKRRLNPGDACCHSVQTLREENRLRVLRIYGPKRDEVTRGWKKLHNEELHNLYSLPSVIRIIKSKRMKWAGHVVGVGAENILMGSQKERGH